MDLIIKPTEVCNFKCTFCSSTKISENHTSVLDLEYVFKFLKRFPNTNTIIVNGGDPLMMKPKYYWDIIEYLDKNNFLHRAEKSKNKRIVSSYFFNI